MLRYLTSLSFELGCIPPSNFGEQTYDWVDIDKPSRARLLTLMTDKPKSDNIKALFGSWISALIEAGIVDATSSRASRGYTTKARDGHVCFSLGEKSFDDLLFRRGIAHERNRNTPRGNFARTSRWAIHSARKMICRKHRISLILIGPGDIISRSRMEQILSSLNH